MEATLPGPGPGMPAMVGWLQELGRRHGVRLSARQQEELLFLDSLLVAWARAVRLIGFETEEERWERYHGEPLLALKWAPEGGDAVDVGSGGGSPALPMAICRPGLRWTLLEPNRKKAVFLEEAGSNLGLRNVSVRRQRFRDFRPESAVQLVTTRGVALPKGSLRKVAPWLDRGGVLLLFTGEKPGSLLAREAAPEFTLQADERLATRHRPRLLVLKRV